MDTAWSADHLTNEPFDLQNVLGGILFSDRADPFPRLPLIPLEMQQGPVTARSTGRGNQTLTPLLRPQAASSTSQDQPGNKIVLRAEGGAPWEAGNPGGTALEPE